MALLAGLLATAPVFAQKVAKEVDAKCITLAPINLMNTGITHPGKTYSTLLGVDSSVGDSKSYFLGGLLDYKGFSAKVIGAVNDLNQTFINYSVGARQRIFRPSMSSGNDGLHLTYQVGTTRGKGVEEKAVDHAIKLNYIIGEKGIVDVGVSQRFNKLLNNGMQSIAEVSVKVPFEEQTMPLIKGAGYLDLSRSFFYIKGGVTYNPAVKQAGKQTMPCKNPNMCGGAKQIRPMFSLGFNF